MNTKKRIVDNSPSYNDKFQKFREARAAAAAKSRAMVSKNKTKSKTAVKRVLTSNKLPLAPKS